MYTSFFSDLGGGQNQHPWRERRPASGRMRRDRRQIAYFFGQRRSTNIIRGHLHSNLDIEQYMPWYCSAERIELLVWDRGEVERGG